MAPKVWKFLVWLHKSTDADLVERLVTEEIRHVDSLLGNRVELTIAEVRRDGQPASIPMSGDEVDWSTLDRERCSKTSLARLLFVSHRDAEYLGDWRGRRIGINTFFLWNRAHAAAVKQLNFRGVLRHELGHLLFDTADRAEFTDDLLLQLENRVNLGDAEAENAYDCRYKQLESPFEDRLVLAFGQHCLKPGCIMRQRVSLRKTLGFEEIADCNYCAACMNKLRGNATTAEAK